MNENNPDDTPITKTGELKVSVIMPAYNEAENIADTIKGLSRIREITEIIVIDDGSSDDTADKAKGPKVKVIRNVRNLGKGGSMEKGLLASSGEIVVFLDADLGDSSSEADKLIKAVSDGKCDMAIAEFYGGKSRKAGFGLVLGLSALGLKWKTGQEFRSPISGQRAFRREAALKLCPIPGGFGAEVGLTIRAHRLGYKILEVPTSMKNKPTGKTLRGFIHRGKQLLHIAKVFLIGP